MRTNRYLSCEAEKKRLRHRIFIKKGINYDRERVRRLRDDRRRRRSSSESDDDEESLPDEESVFEPESDPDEESVSESESESELSTSCCWAMIDLGAFYKVITGKADQYLNNTLIKMNKGNA